MALPNPPLPRERYDEPWRDTPEHKARMARIEAGARRRYVKTLLTLTTITAVCCGLIAVACHLGGNRIDAAGELFAVALFYWLALEGANEL